MKQLNELIETTETALKHLKLAQEAFSKLDLDVTMDKVETVTEESLEDGSLMSEEALYLRNYCENNEIHKKLVERLIRYRALKEYVEEHKRQSSQFSGATHKMKNLIDGVRFSGINWRNSKQGANYWAVILG